MINPTFRISALLSTLMLLSLINSCDIDKTTESPTTESPIRAASAAVNIAVSDTLPIGGWIIPRYTDGEDAKLRAQVMLLTDGTTKVCLGSADVTYLHRSILDEIAYDAEAKYGIPFDNIMIGATHTHGSPVQTDWSDPTADQTLNLAIMKAFMEAIGTANKELENSETESYFSLGHAKIGQNSRLIMEDGSILWVPTIYKFGYNRPTGPYDAQLPVLAFKDREGNLESILYNHSDHNINMPSPVPVRSPSFYGRAAQELEEELGGTIIFLPGAFGSTHVFDDMPTQERVFRAKDGIRRTYAKAEKRTLTGLAAIRHEVTFRVRTSFDAEKQYQEVADYCNRWFKEITLWEADPAPIINAFDRRRENLEEVPEKTQKTWIQAIKIGDIAFVGIPGELFAELGMEIKRRSPFRYTYVVGIANDYIGYLPDLEAYDFGGYQTWAGPNYSEPGTGEAMVDETVKMLESLYQKGNLNHGGDAVKQAVPEVKKSTAEIETGILPPEWVARKDMEGKNLWTMGSALLDPDDSTKFRVTPEGEQIVNTGQGGVGIYTKEEYGDVHIELEFMIPYNGNSGVYPMGKYEVQLWDSYGKPLIMANQWMGTIVATKEPDAHPERPGGAWQKLSIDFRAPRFDSNGEKSQNALFEKVILNGVVVQENVEVPEPTPVCLPGDESETGPVLLQGFTGPVSYKNIMIVPLEMESQ